MSNPFSAVFDAIGSVAEFVIDNALPIIETVALNYFAPGISGALGISELAVKAVGNAALSAMNGGSIASIATAGLMPYINSPGWMKENLGIDFSPSGFISKPIADALGNTDLANIVASAAGASTTGALVGAITGADIGKAALNAGLGSLTSQAIQRTWTSIQQNLPKFDTMHAQASELTQNINDSQSFIDQVRAVQTQLEKNPVFDYQAKTDQYNQLKSDWQVAKDAGDVSKANSIAQQANSIASYLNDPTTINTIKEIDMPAYNNLLAYRDSLINNNQQLITDYSNNVNQLNSLNTQYDLLTNQVQADYSNFQMADALSKGNFTDAAKYYTDLQNYNNSALKLDPSAITTAPSLSTTQADFLSKYSTDPSKYGAQAPQVFADYKETTPTTDTTGTTGTTTNPYDQLPKYPGTDTTTPTTDTTTSTGTTNTSTDTNATQQTTPPPSKVDVSKLQPTPTNIVQNVLSNAIKQGIVSNIVGGITGGNTGGTGTGTQPKPTVQPPAKHVDVSILKPFTGTLPTGLPSTTPTTPTSPTTTQTGGLGTTTNTTQTPIQTANSGLQSVSQPQTQLSNKPASHVDISTLTPVTNTTQLANLGLNLG